MTAKEDKDGRKYVPVFFVQHFCVDKINSMFYPYSVDKINSFFSGDLTMDKNFIQQIRAFNRYYTAWLDVMNKKYLETDFSWPESRVIFEIYISGELSATDLCQRLHMDKSYVSRIIGKFEKQGLLTREVVPGRKGLKLIKLTEAGKTKAWQIDKNGDRQIAEKLKNIDDEACRKLSEAMAFIEKVLRENA